MKKITIVSCFLLFLGSVLLVSQQSFTKGTPVFAEWVSNGWYHGKIGEPCDKGHVINFDDGDVKCCSASQIVPNVVPTAGSITEGAKVLAQWTNGRYYPGTVASVDGEICKINFDDGDKGSAHITKIRLRN